MSEKGGTGRYPMSEKAMNELSTNNNEWYGTFEPVTSKRWLKGDGRSESRGSEIGQ